MTLSLHDDELKIDVRLVAELIRRAMPDLALLPLRAFESTGSSNAMFRLGDDLLVRLPRQPGGSATIEKEARWLPYLAGLLPSAIPEVMYVGEPGFGYSERWSVVGWLDGVVPGPADASERLAVELAAFVNALRGVDVPDSALADPQLRWYRGEPLESRDEATQRSIAECRDLVGLDLDLEACSRVWSDAMDLPRARGPRSWYHGDLFAENLLVRDGHLAAVLDFGGLSVGDPTVDLIVAWELLDEPSRGIFRESVQADEVTWIRGRAWALSLALMTFPYYWDTMPGRCGTKLAVARAVLADAAASA